MKWPLRVLAALGCIWIYQHEEEIPSAPTGTPRIISLIPSLTENLYAVGADDTVVGVTTWCTYPEEARRKEKIGDVIVNVEAVIRLRPTAIVSSEGMMAASNRELERLGLRIERFDPVTLEDIGGDLDRLAGLAGVSLGAGEEFRRELSELTLRDPSHRPTVYFEASSDPPYTAGPGSTVHDLIVRAGGRNAFEDLGRPWATIEWEQVVARDPDVLLIGRGLQKQVETRPGWKALHGRVHFMDGDIYVRPTPRILLGLGELSRWLHP